MKVRLALREEGKFWNAYLALEHTMQDAKLIGSVSIGAVKKNPQARVAFMELMKLILADAIEDVTGDRPPDWDVRPGPEAERSGHG